jgi:tRNA dimethylallyltransferase
MDVGTDKASSETRKRVIHHLIDVVDPDERFTVMDFSRLSLDAVRRIRARGKRVILAGGTPFYYKALLEGAVQDDLP